MHRKDRANKIINILLVGALILIIIAAFAFYTNIIEIRNLAEESDDDLTQGDSDSDLGPDSGPGSDETEDQEPDSEPDQPGTDTSNAPSGSSSMPTDTPSEPSDDPNSEPDSPQDDKPEPTPNIDIHPKKSWTTLFYVAYDNSIGPSGIWESDRHYLEQIGSDDNINLVALVDQEVVGDCHVLIINEGESLEYPITVIDPNWGDELNTGDPEVLLKFLKWGVEIFPAEYYDFHMMDHGGGWLGACIDDHEDGSIIRSHEFAEVFREIKQKLGKKLDIVSFDACFMASFEFGWEVSDSVSYLTGMQTIAAGDNDEEYIKGNFEVYETWSGLKENPNWTPEEFAIHQVNSFYKVGPYMMPSLGQTHPYSSDTMSTSDLSKIEGLKESFSKLCQELFDSVTGKNETLAERQLVLEIIGPSTGPPEQNTETFSGQSDFIRLGIYYFYDLGDFVDRLIEFGNRLCSKETAMEFKDLFESVVVACTHGDDAKLGEHPDAHGLDVYLPYRNGKYDTRYDETKITQDTLWDEFLNEIPWDSY